MKKNDFRGGQHCVKILRRIETGLILKTPLFSYYGESGTMHAKLNKTAKGKTNERCHLVLTASSNYRYGFLREGYYFYRDFVETESNEKA